MCVLVTFSGAEVDVWRLKLLVYEALSYWCMSPYVTSAWGLKLLFLVTLSAAEVDVWGLKLVVHEALSY